MKKKILLIVLSCLLIGTITVVAFSWSEESEVSFEDNKLEGAVRTELEKESGAIRKEDLQQIETLDISNSGIKSLEGVEDIGTLRSLDASGNNIHNIEVLGEMIYLENLNLEGNHVQDFSPLEGVDRLVTLNLRNTGLESLDVIYDTRTLTALDVRSNNLTSIEEVEQLSLLETLNIRNNNISDLAPIEGLNELKNLNVRENNIEDFSSVFELPNLNERLFVEGNPGADIEAFQRLQTQVEDMDLPPAGEGIVFSEKAGSYEEPIELTLEIPEPEKGDTVRYTMDGSVPGNQSEKYSAPIAIDQSTVVKAAIVDAYGNVGEIVSNSFIIGEESTFSMLSISGNPGDFFGEGQGIYAEGPDPENPNYEQRGDDWERESHIELFDEEGNLEIEQGAGVRIHGNYSRKDPKKSFRLYARSDYGEETFNSPIFENSTTNEHKRLLIRSGGQDWSTTVFRDAFVQDLVQGMGFETQASRPVNVYLNGEYWGVYNIRERFDDDYFAYNHGVQGEDLDLLSNNASISEGENDHYTNMLDYIENNNIKDPEVYEEVQTRMDTDNYIDYVIAQIFIRNVDWPSNNVDYWREKPDGKWKWLMYDTDMSFSVAMAVDVTKTEVAAHNTLALATDEGRSQWPNYDWSTFLLRSLMKNETFKQEFAARFTVHMEETLDEKRINEKLNEFENFYAPEMEKEIERWDGIESMGHWRGSINNMRQFADNRSDFVFAHLIDYMGVEGKGTASIQLNENVPLEINDKAVHIENGAWKGEILKEVPYRLTVDGERAHIGAQNSSISFTADEQVEKDLLVNGESVGTVTFDPTPVEKEEINLTVNESIELPPEEEVVISDAYTDREEKLGEVEENTFRALNEGTLLLTARKDGELTKITRVNISK